MKLKLRNGMELCPDPGTVGMLSYDARSFVRYTPYGLRKGMIVGVCEGPVDESGCLTVSFGPEGIEVPLRQLYAVMDAAGK